MPLFEMLSESEVKNIIRSLPNVTEKACRFVNMGMSVLVVSSVTNMLTTFVNDNNQISRKINGADVIQTLRFIAASFYGQLAPLVLSRWGIKRDDDVREIILRIAMLSDHELDKQLRDKRYYIGTRIAQPLEDFDDIESFDELLYNSGFFSFL